MLKQVLQLNRIALNKLVVRLNRLQKSLEVSDSYNILVRLVGPNGSLSYNRPLDVSGPAPPPNLMPWPSPLHLIKAIKNSS